jgi:hypothetical protein
VTTAGPPPLPPGGASADRPLSPAPAYNAALDDVDVPIHAGAHRQGASHPPNGARLGEWAGCDLLFWKMEGREREHGQKRRKGPRKV